MSQVVGLPRRRRRAPIAVNGKVPPRRQPNRVTRSREYLTADEAGIPPLMVVDLDAARGVLPRAVERYLATVADLGNAVLTDVARAREAIREIVVEVSVWPCNGHLSFEKGLNETPSLLSQEGRHR